MTPAARRDVHEMSGYTRRHWGGGHAASYRGGVRRTIELLRDSTELRMIRDEVRPGLRSFPSKQHVLVYRIAASERRILRILHCRQDLEGAWE